jgi:hypothetical protein
MTAMPITRVILYKHGVGYFERQGAVDGDGSLTLTFKQSEVSDVLKSLTVLDFDGGHIAAVSYDSTKPLEQLLAEVALSIPDQDSLVGLLPQIKGARIAVEPPRGGRTEGALLGIDHVEREREGHVVRTALVTVMTDGGAIHSFDLHGLTRLEVLDAALRRDLEYYLRTVLSSKKKDTKTFTFLTRGSGERRIGVNYTVAAPVWKATYRIILGEESASPLLQGWAVVDNTQDEDWEDVQLSLVAGLPVSFEHDLYTPRYIRRPVVAVQETTGVLPPTVEEGMALSETTAAVTVTEFDAMHLVPKMARATPARARGDVEEVFGTIERMTTSTPAQVRERKLGDFFEYQIEHPLSIRRNQSALVPIVLRSFEGRPVLLYNKNHRPESPMRCVELKNTTGLTLEGGPVTVLEDGSYVGEAMLETLKPDEQRLVPFAVELGVRVLDNIDSHQDAVQRVIIKDRRLTTYRLQVGHTTYTFDNKGEADHTVYLEHPRGGAEWGLFDTAPPYETTDTYWRFRFRLAAKSTATFTVRQRMTVERVESFSDLAPARLSYWVQQRCFDDRAASVLRQALELEQQDTKAGEQLALFAEEADRIHTEQGRIRENLQSLGDRATEKELRERFVRSLNTQEDRLEQISQETKRINEVREGWRAQINALLSSLHYEATMT